MFGHWQKVTNLQLCARFCCIKPTNFCIFSSSKRFLNCSGPGGKSHCSQTCESYSDCQEIDDSKLLLLFQSAAWHELSKRAKYWNTAKIIRKNGRKLIMVPPYLRAFFLNHDDLTDTGRNKYDIETNKVFSGPCGGLQRRSVNPQ